MLQGTHKYRSARDMFDAAYLDNPEQIIGYKAVSEQDEKIGSIKDYVFDHSGRLRYLVVDTGFWIFGKTVLVPVGMIEVDDVNRQVLIRSLTKQQVEDMPPYESADAFTEEHEDRLLQNYYPNQTINREETTRQVNYENYQQGFKTPERLQLLEERLQIDKHNEKMGEVTLRKQVDIRQEHVDVPVTRDKLVIETRPVETGMGATASANLNQTTAGVIGDDQTITVPLYSEQVDVNKRTVVAQEVVIRKEQETVTEHIESDTRHERLDVSNEQLNVERRDTATSGTRQNTLNSDRLDTTSSDPRDETFANEQERLTPEQRMSTTGSRLNPLQ